MTNSSATLEVKRHRQQKGKTNAGGLSLVIQEAAQEGKSLLGYKESSGMQLKKQQKDLAVSKCSEQF